MAAYVITNKTNAYLFKAGGITKAYPKNTLGYRLDDNDAQVLEIIQVNSRTYRIDLATDTLNIDGVTVWANAAAAAAALESIFFFNASVLSLQYVESTDSPYTVDANNTNQLIVADTTAGNVTVIIPDLIDVPEGWQVRLYHHAGTGVVTITTVSGTDLVDKATSTFITATGNAVTLCAEVISGTPEYLPTQDSRGNPNNRYVITKPSDFLTPLDSSAIYFVDRSVDMGSTSIEVPTGGLTIAGYGFGVSQLTSAANTYSMFTSPIGGAGDLFITGLEITVSGTGSKVFDINNTVAGGNSAIECSTVNFISCTSLGEQTGYRQGLWSNVALIACQDGLTLSGTWSGGYRLDTCIVIAHASGAGVFKEGTSFIVGTRFVSNMNMAGVSASGFAFNFQPSNFTNDASFQLVDGIYNSNANNIPNFPSTNTKARFRNNTGITNTFVGAEVTWTVSAATSASTTPAILAGTTVTTENAWLTQIGNNQLQNSSTLPIALDLNGSFSLSAGTNEEYEILVRIFRNIGSAYETVKTMPAITTNGGPAGTRAENAAVLAVFTLQTLDILEIHIQKTATTGSVTAAVNSSYILSERIS